jgi:hypothetical protein
MKVSFAPLAASASTMFKSIFCGLALMMFVGSIARADEPHRVTGKVFIQQVQIAFIGSGAAGKGTLTFRGHTYPIKVVGLGVGGVGLSKLTATARCPPTDADRYDP